MYAEKIIMSNLAASYWGNSLQEYLTTAVYFLILIAAFKLVQVLLLVRLDHFSKTTKSDIDDQLIKITKSIRFPVYALLALSITLKTLQLPSLGERVIDAVLFIVVIYQAIKSINIVVGYTAEKLIKRDTNEAERSAIRLLTKITKGVLWVIGLLLVLQNLGINVTSLIAGLGIGGIAIGFALQNILGDLFSSFAIIFDKPFEPGDFIVVGDDMGEVEKIGIKTTRIRALQGEEIVISNQELTSSRIQNFKKMEKRRVTFSVGLTYDTGNDALKNAIDKIEGVIKKHSKLEFDRAHFMEFGDSALLIEVVYYILSSDYNEYMDVHQSILMEIKEYLEKEDIGIAFPTQTIYLEK